jgi:hypothetical protein
VREADLRIKQPNTARGSLRWVRQLLYTQPEKLQAALSLPAEAPIRWVSPRAEDDHAEYRDRAALDLLGVSCAVRPLTDYWPNRGPQWDALGRFGERGVVLLEAKANLAELKSPGSKASATSLVQIERACAEAKPWFGAPAEATWVGKYYQYANRLAHLYFLREVNRLDAHLVFLYFLNDPHTRGPSSQQEWQTAIAKAHSALGLPEHLVPAVHEVFINVQHIH